MLKLLNTPKLTQGRIIAAFAVALLADGIQFMLGPVGWIGLVQVIDVVTMIIQSWLLGFHPLFLPTFVVEFIPVVDMLPTWTACVALVVSMRRRSPPEPPRPPASSPTPSSGAGDVIDV